MATKNISDGTNVHLIFPGYSTLTICGESLSGMYFEKTDKGAKVDCPDCAKVIRAIRKVRVKGDRT
jgi:hypothetical protein